MAKKFLTPVVPPSLAADPSNAVAGAIYYNTAVNSLKFYDGTTWSLIGAGGGGGGTSNALELLEEAPSSPSQGRLYFDTTERTIKIYNGNIWYDVAGPKEILDHTHYAGEGPVRNVQYGGYVSSDLVFVDGGNSGTTLFTGDILDGGNS
jgi:hypothetical protein